MIGQTVRAEVTEERNGSCGVRIVMPDGTSRIFCDVSRNREELNAFVEGINRCGVSSVHIEELLEDHIG